MQIFSEYYQNNYWADDESVSGAGSTLEATKSIRVLIPKLIESLGVKTLLDIPCGDLNWAREMLAQDQFWGLEQYIGADVVPGLIADLRRKYNHPNATFQTLDITTDPLPTVDMVLVRDLLGHFSNADVQWALRNLKRSNSRYLLSTTFPERETKGDIMTGQWRPINLASLFGLSNPKIILNEGCTMPGFEDKSLGLWDLWEER